MSRREYHHSPKCAADGCSERAHYVFSSQREQREEMARLRKRGGWRCLRHSEPEGVLGVDNPTRTQTVIASRSPKYDLPNHLFWIYEGGDSGSGFIFGPGFRAFANDFPEGTRLTITATVELPAAERGKP